MSIQGHAPSARKRRVGAFEAFTFVRTVSNARGGGENVHKLFLLIR